MNFLQRYYDLAIEAATYIEHEVRTYGAIDVASASTRPADDWTLHELDELPEFVRIGDYDTDQRLAIIRLVSFQHQILVKGIEKGDEFPSESWIELGNMDEWHILSLADFLQKRTMY